MQIYNDKPKKVIAGIFEKNGKVLIAQRAKEDSLKNKWEFPGGKVELGETFEQCLKRELFEEFEIEAEIGEYVCSSFFTYQSKQMELLSYKVKSFSGEFKLKEHKEIKWVNISDLLSYEFPEPDLVIIETLQNQIKHSI